MLLIVSDGHPKERELQGATRNLGTVHYGQAHCACPADIAGSRQLARPHHGQTVQSRACQDSAAVMRSMASRCNLVHCACHLAFNAFSNICIQHAEPPSQPSPETPILCRRLQAGYSGLLFLY
jgi:hypothetical protein